MTRMEKYQDLRNRLSKEEMERRQIELAEACNALMGPSQIEINDAWNAMFGDPNGEIENLLEVISVRKRNA